MSKKTETVEVPTVAVDSVTEPYFIPSLGITVLAASLDEALAFAEKLRSK